MDTLALARAAAAALLAGSIASCARIERLPLPKAVPPPVSIQAEDSPLKAPVSALLDPGELAALLDETMPAADNVVSAPLSGKEVFAGYVAGRSSPRYLASVSRLGDSRGSLVLMVGMEQADSGARITRVKAARAEGNLYGMAAFEERKPSFLAQFAGRRENEVSREVDAVSGATSISNALASAVSEEASELADLLANPEKLGIYQPAGPSSALAVNEGQEPKADKALRLGTFIAEPALTPEDYPGLLSAVALALEIFLAGLILALVLVSGCGKGRSLC